MATGTNLSLQFFPASWQGEQRQTPTREYVDFEREAGKVRTKSISRDFVGLFPTGFKIRTRRFEVERLCYRHIQFSMVGSLKSFGKVYRINACYLNVATV